MFYIPPDVAAQAAKAAAEYRPLFVVRVPAMPTIGMPETDVAFHDFAAAQCCADYYPDAEKWVFDSDQCAELALMGGVGGLAARVDAVDACDELLKRL